MHSIVEFEQIATSFAISSNFRLCPPSTRLKPSDRLGILD